MRFVKRLQSVDACSLKLRPDQTVDQFRRDTIDAFRQHHPTVAIVQARQLCGQVPFDNGRPAPRNVLPDSLPLEVDKFQALPIRRLPVGFVKPRRQVAAPDHQKGAGRGRARNIFPDDSPIKDRPGQKHHKADQHGTTTRLHRTVERRRRVDQQRADRRRPRDRQDVLRHVSQRPRVVLAVVTADHENSLADENELNHIDEQKLERSDQKLVPAHVTDRTVNKNPTDDIDRQADESHQPFFARDPGDGSRLRGRRGRVSEKAEPAPQSPSPLSQPTLRPTPLSPSPLSGPWPAVTCPGQRTMSGMRKPPS